MDSFWTRYKNELLLAALLFVQVIGLATQVRVPQKDGEGRAEPNGTRLIRVWGNRLVNPFQKAYVNSGAGVRGMWRNYIDLRNVRQENYDLKKQLEELRIQQARIHEDAAQGRRVQALLGFKDQFISKTVAAQVIGTSGTTLSRVIYLDRGANDGIAPGLAVITPDGIVGKVLRAEGKSSQVLLISDPTSGAGVLLERLRLNGVLHGTSGAYPEVSNIMADEKIEPGDRIITTGGDRVFPKGLPVGTVISTARDKEMDGFLSIRVKPAVNLSQLEEVLVITEMAESAPVTSDQPLRASQVLVERLPSVKKKAVKEVDNKVPANAGETPAIPAGEASMPPSQATPAPNPPALKPAGNEAAIVPRPGGVPNAPPANVKKPQTTPKKPAEAAPTPDDGVNN